LNKDDLNAVYENRDSYHLFHLEKRSLSLFINLSDILLKHKVQKNNHSTIMQNYPLPRETGKLQRAVTGRALAVRM